MVGRSVDCVVAWVVGKASGVMTTIGGDDGGNDCCEGGVLVSFGCGTPLSVDVLADMLGPLGST